MKKEGIFTIILLLSFLILAKAAYSAVVSHSADEITDGNLNFTGNVSFNIYNGSYKSAKLDFFNYNAAGSGMFNLSLYNQSGGVVAFIHAFEGSGKVEISGQTNGEFGSSGTSKFFSKKNGVDTAKVETGNAGTITTTAADSSGVSVWKEIINAGSRTKTQTGTASTTQDTIIITDTVETMIRDVSLYDVTNGNLVANMQMRQLGGANQFLWSVNNGPVDGSEMASGIWSDNSITWTPKGSYVVNAQAGTSSIATFNIGQTTNLTINNTGLYVYNGTEHLQFAVEGTGVTNGLVTIGTTLKLNVTDIQPTCNAAGEGMMYGDDSMNAPCYCNGTGWQVMYNGSEC